MAFRRRKTADRRTTKESKTKPFRLPPMPSQDGSSFMNPQVVQMPTNPPPDNSCQLMQWGTTYSPTQVTMGGPGYGPQVQLNPEPPLYGQWAGTDILQFQQAWGLDVVNNGNYYMPASGTINMSFDFIMTTHQGYPSNGTWSLIAIMPGMMFYSLRLTSKATVKRADGTLIPCWFEVKNLIPFLAFDGSWNPNQGSGGYGIGGFPGNWGTTGSEPWMQDGTGYLPQYAYHYHFAPQQIPLDKCLWKNDGLVFHPPGQGLDGVNGPYGLDANFGLDMNQSVPFLNHWGYGDAIYLEGISASINPWWGFDMCSYSVGVDSDGDGVPDDYYGDYLWSDQGGVVIGVNNTFGNDTPLQTMVPGGPIALHFV